MTTETHELATRHQPRLSGIASHQEALGAADEFAASIADGVIQRDRSGELPAAELADLDASGLLSITVPVRYGGSGLGAVTLAEVIATIAAVDPAIAQAAQGHFLFVDVLRAFGSEAQKQRLFADAVRGRRIANALAERGGVHAQDLRTHLSADHVLDGKKYYATGALTAHWIATTALNSDQRQVLAFVPREHPGVTLDQDWNVMGQRATVSGSVTYEGIEVDPELVIDYAHCFEVPQQFGARAQLFHTAIQIGIAQGALRDARWFVGEKARPFFEAARSGVADRAVEDPHTLHRFGEMATRIAAARALMLESARELDQIRLVPADAQAAARGSIAVAQAKAFASETAVSVASDLFSLTGASAADAKYDLDRHWRNARTHASHDPVDWKYHHIGAYALAGQLPPNHGQL